MFNIDAARADAAAFADQDPELKEEQHGQVQDSGAGIGVAEATRGEDLAHQTGDDYSASQPESTGSAGLPEESQDPQPDGRQGSDDLSQSGGSSEPQRSKQAIGFVNGAKFYKGELLPWKGIQFQVIYLKGHTVILQGIDFTGKERKRLEKHYTQR
jgi:hypothetical protein